MIGQTSVWVAGEALMDLIPVAGGERRPMVGGGPANTAKAVARLGYSISFIGGISTDDYGRAIDAELSNSGVDLSLVLRADLPTALAIATIDENGLAKYDFELADTTSFAFDSSWLPDGDVEVIHLGSVATLLEPGSSQLLKWASSKSTPIIFDPNVRPSIEGDKDLYRAAVERWIDVATIVKLSEDDLNWLYGHDEESVIKLWLSRGVELVVVTRAEKGLRAYRNGAVVEVPAVVIDLVDSVGAGDTIGAVLVEGVLTHGITGLKDEILRSVLVRAAKAAAITCSRAGANPPWREELERA
jgi:fructokinase